MTNNALKKKGPLQSPFGLGSSLTAAFLIFALAPLTLISFISYNKYLSSLHESTHKTLEVAADMKTREIKAYFSKMVDDLSFASEGRSTIIFLKELIEAKQAFPGSLSEFIGVPEGKTVDITRANELIKFQKKFKYYDTFLISTSGDILFTVTQENDLGTNLYSGAYQSTQFAIAFRESIKTESTVFSDYERYSPSHNLVSGFIVTPVHDAGGILLGAMAIQFPIDPINRVMHANTDIGETFETFLVGSDMTLRSTSIRDTSKGLIQEKINTLQALKFQEHNAHHEDDEELEHNFDVYMGHADKMVLGIHRDFSVQNVLFGVFAEIEEKEAFAHVYRLKQSMFIAIGFTTFVVIFFAFLTVRSIVNPIILLSKGARRAESGDYSQTININGKNEIGMLADSFNTMLSALEKNRIENHLTKWFQKGEVELNTTMQGAQELPELCHKVITFMAKYLTADIGVLYVADENKLLCPTGFYALPPNTALCNLKHGQGLVGQAALEQRRIILDHDPDETIKIYTGFGAVLPKTVLIAPFSRSDTVVSVMVLGSLRAFSEEELEFIDIAGLHIAIAIQTLLSHITTQTQARELSIRQEELRITNEKLEEKARDLELTSKYKSEFLANMSHEIRTPMNGVIGMTGLLMDTDLNDEQRHYAETVRGSGDALLSLINDILDFSKIEAGKLEIETLDFDLNDLLGDFAEMMALKAHEKGLEFICTASHETPALLQGDPGRVRQILTNLVANAIKFTNKGEIDVRASLDSETDKTAIIRFTVRDTGIGIPEEKRSTLFDQFTQVDASTTRKYGGTGLGLAISKQLTEAMSGNIGIYSELNRGTEFWFTIRFLKQSSQKRQDLPSPDIQGAKILVVDDNETNREILHVQLNTWGMCPQEVPDGESGLQRLKEAADIGEPFQLAILDMQMPEMDGEMLGRAIRSTPLFDDTLLVMMTSLGQREDKKKLGEIGFAAYLTKPVRQTDLFTSLISVLAGHKENTWQPITRSSIHGMKLEGHRVLLAEDNTINQKVGLGILKKLEIHADAVANGREAVKALSTIPYDLVLMDCQMPEMDGFEATRIIRSTHSNVLNHDIPIIALTANAMSGDREKCLEAGMNDFISKPFNPETLASTLQKWFSHKPNPPQE